MHRKIIRNITSITFSDVLIRGIFLLFSIVVARSIELKEFAVFSLSVSLGVYFWAVVDGGITGHSIKLVARANAKHWPQIIGTTTATRLGLALIFSIILVLILLLTPLPVYEVTVYLLSMIYVYAISVFPAWFSRGTQDNFAYFINYLTVAVFIAASLILFYALDQKVPQNALSAILFRNIAWLIGALCAFVYVMRRKQVNIHLSDIRLSLPTLKLTYPLGAAAILYSLLPLLPQLFLRYFNLKYELALYASAWILQQVLIAGAGIFSASLVPVLSTSIHTYNNYTKLLKVHFSLVAITGLAVSVIWYLAGGSSIVMLFGADYAAAQKIIPLFSATVMIVFLRASIDAVLIVKGQYRQMMVSGLSVLTLMLVLIFINEHKDIVAMAKVYFFGETLLLLLNLFFSLTQHQKPTRNT